jgi:hypothetical protein
MENLAQILFDRLDRRQITPLAVKDEYRLFCRGWNACKPAGQRQQDYRNDGAKPNESEQPSWYSGEHKKRQGNLSQQSRKSKEIQMSLDRAHSLEICARSGLWQQNSPVHRSALAHLEKQRTLKQFQNIEVPAAKPHRHPVHCSKPGRPVRIRVEKSGS